MLKSTNKVTARIGITGKTNVFMSRVKYGEVKGGYLIISTKPSASVLHSLMVFADKNRLKIKS